MQCTFQEKKCILIKYLSQTAYLFLKKCTNGTKNILRHAIFEDSKQELQIKISNLRIFRKQL